MKSIDISRDRDLIKKSHKILSDDGDSVIANFLFAITGTDCISEATQRTAAAAIENIECRWFMKLF